MARDVGALLVSLGFYAIVASVIATLWRTAAAVRGGHLAGYTGRQLTWYLYWSEAAITSLNPRQIETTGDDIASGAVAVDLLRPASVVGLRIVTELGRALPRLAGSLVIGFFLASAIGGGPVSWTALALSVPSLVLAMACNLTAQHACAGAAFWIRDARSTWFLYQKLVFLLGAMLMPVQILPSWLQSAAWHLPFLSMAYAPARLAAGFWEPGLLAQQLMWLVVLGVVAFGVFQRGERRLQVIGG
jgi:ABC-2 type transport system permease protein